jgi:hypothetical protein
MPLAFFLTPTPTREPVGRILDCVGNEVVQRHGKQRLIAVDCRRQYLPADDGYPAGLRCHAILVYGGGNHVRVEFPRLWGWRVHPRPATGRAQ